ncbi:MAG: GAF domain-containing protein [Gammaproteobacteria bacterium]|nr:GAF domain-containing protein [Gammaproteobacteria bacterium]
MSHDASMPRVIDGDYAPVVAALRALLAGEHDFDANVANFVALAYHALPEINWLGFYWLRQGELVVGTFQGKPACTRIAMGKGVCGTAALRRAPLIVEDVLAFAGHIACDPASRSEIVIPVLAGERLLGVLDVDSPRPGRFDARDQAGLSTMLEVLLASSPIP